MGDRPWPASSNGSICSRIARQRSNSACQSIGGPLRPVQAPAASLQRVLSSCLVRHHTRSRSASQFMCPRGVIKDLRQIPTAARAKKHAYATDFPSPPASRSQSFQPGKSGGEAATAALTSAKAACKAASFVWSREVFSTVPPSPLSLSRTLSAVTLRTSTKSAAVPG